MESDPGPFVVSPFVLAELDYLLATVVPPQDTAAFIVEPVLG